MVDIVQLVGTKSLPAILPATCWSGMVAWLQSAGRSAAMDGAGIASSGAAITATARQARGPAQNVISLPCFKARPLIRPLPKRGKFNQRAAIGNAPGLISRFACVAHPHPDPPPSRGRGVGEKGGIGFGEREDEESA